MKKYLLFVFLVSSSIVLSQNKIAEKVHQLQIEQKRFVPVSVLNVNTNKDIDAEKVVTNATYATINLQKINEIVANKYDFIELEIPYENQMQTLLLYRVNPFAEGFHVDTNRGKNIAFEQGVYYRGIINGENNSVASFNFFKNEFNGVFSSNELGNIVVGKLEKQNNQLDYIVYSDAKMKVQNGFECATKEGEVIKNINSQSRRDVNTDRCVTFYFEIDYNIYENNGLSTDNTINWMTSVFNNVQTLFNNDGISTAIKNIFIWVDGDPYEGIGNSSSDYLQAFSETSLVFDGDVGMLVGIDPGGLGGVAFLDTICTQNKYSYADVNMSYSSVPTYSWTIQVITHEFGHSLGSRHTHACAWNGNNTSIDGCGTQAGYSEGSCPIGPIPSSTEKGTIMSYCHLIGGVGISFNNGFGPQPANLIFNNVNDKTCLSFDCINTCINTVTEIAISSVSSDSVSFTWTDISTSNSSWKVAVVTFNNTNPINWTTVTNPQFLATGLIPNTFYKILITPVCTDVEPVVKEQIFATNGNFCSNMPFTDTGGTSAEYTDMENWTRTFIPGNGQKIRVTFSSFNLEADYDYLYAFNGPNEYYPELGTTGGFTGTSLPPVLNSTHTSGTMTFKFVSDQAVTAPGWNAVVTCTGTLGNETNDYLDFGYFPNPTKGVVTIKSNTTITEVIVYNIEGRRLFSQTINALEDNINISQFATGTYFFKAKFGDKEVNFKILKL